jgi:hypothetical protein
VNTTEKRRADRFIAEWYEGKRGVDIDPPSPPARAVKLAEQAAKIRETLKELGWGTNWDGELIVNVGGPVDRERKRRVQEIRNAALAKAKNLSIAIWTNELDMAGLMKELAD